MTEEKSSAKRYRRKFHPKAVPNPSESMPDLPKAAGAVFRFLRVNTDPGRSKSRKAARTVAEPTIRIVRTRNQVVFLMLENVCPL